MSQPQPEYAVRKLMVDHLGLSPLGSRIYALMPPQGTAMPYAWVEAPQDLPTRHQAGASGISSALITVHVASDTYSQMADLLTEIRIAINATIAKTVTYDVNKSVFIHDATVERLQKIPDGPSDGGDRPLFIGFADINVWYSQPTS